MNEWITCPKPNPQARLRLFCFPYAGGGASIFRLWPNDMSPQMEVYPIQLPGRERRLSQPLFTQLSSLLEQLVPVLYPYLDRPFALFGHSMGALISFELARKLRRLNGPSPLCLFVSARRAPQLPDPNPPLHRLPDPDFVVELARLQGTPEEVLHHAEIMELMLPILRADFTLCETYRYMNEEPLDCPISALGGQQDHMVSDDDLSAWREQTHRAFNLRMFPGSHFFLRHARTLLVRAISQDVKRLL